MIKQLILFAFLCLVLLIGCGTAKKAGTYGSPKIEQVLLTDNMFKVTEQSTNRSYGYTIQNPIMVGGGTINGPLNERRLLNALAGPNGEEIVYKRLGSCCGFRTTNSPFGTGMLDMYEINYKGLDNPIILYLNMYDSDTLKVPVGFKSFQSGQIILPTS